MSVRAWPSSTHHHPRLQAASRQAGRAKAAQEHPVTFYDPPVGLKRRRAVLNERPRDYYVQLQRPLQLQLFHDPDSCKVVVHRIFSSCNKSEALLLQPGDSLMLAGDVSAPAHGWDHAALSKLLPVLMDDSSILGCVFRRPERPPGKRQGYVWYSAGVSGSMSTQGGSLGMLADHSVLVIPQTDEIRHAGKQLRVCFHQLRQGETQFMRRFARPQSWRHALDACVHVPPLILSSDSACTKPPSTWTIAGKGGYPPPKPTSSHAVLPWLLVVRGSLKQGGLEAMCAQFGKSSLDIVRLSTDKQQRPRLWGAHGSKSPLDAFVDAVCGTHAAAVRAGLPPRLKWGTGCSHTGDGYWGPKDWGVALAAPTEAPDAAATVVAACLHWLGCLPLDESIAVARKRCDSGVNEGLIRAATCKLARERTFRPQPLRVTWPYGGSDDVVLLINTSTHSSSSGNGTKNSSNGNRNGNGSGNGNSNGSSLVSGRTVNPAHQPHSPWRPAGKGAVAALKQKKSALQAEVIYAGTKGQDYSSGRGGNRMSSGGSREAGDVKEVEGCQQIIMEQSKSGLYFADLLVRPHRTRKQVRYAFNVRGIRGVDPAQPLTKSADGQLMNVAAVTPRHLPAALETHVARVQAARLVMLMRRNTIL